MTATAISQTRLSSRSMSVIVPTSVGRRVSARIVSYGKGYRLDLYIGTTH